MEENGIITGMIPSVGSGIRKTYEESIIRYSKAKGLESYKNQYFMDKSGNLIWADDESEYEKHMSNPELTKVDILALEVSQDGTAYYEIIDSKVLRRHLIAEAVERRTQNIDNNDQSKDSTFQSIANGIRKTFPESTYLLLDELEFREMSRFSYLGIYFSKKIGNIVFPYMTKDYANSGYRNIEERRVALDEITSHIDEYIELSMINVLPNGVHYMVELIDKNILDVYTSENGYKLTL